MKQIQGLIILCRGNDLSFPFEQRSEGENFVNICGKMFQSEGITYSKIKLGIRLTDSYGVNVVFPQIHVLNPDHQCDDTGR